MKKEVKYGQLYKNKEFDKMKSKSKCYGMKLSMEEVYIKIYNKSDIDHVHME